MPRLSRSRRSDILKALSESHISIRTLPNLSDLAQGKLNENVLRELQIEDLLGRDPVEPIPELLSKTITGKVVLVTGAGGSIGSELCRQIAQLGPRHLIMLDVSEHALYNISSEIELLVANLQSTSTPALSSILANVLDQERLDGHFALLRPQTVFHAAAYKHVPLVQVNPIMGISNNTLGTYHCAAAAITNHADDFILISTDKAVRPTSVMGASKRFAEMILQALSDTQMSNAPRTRFGIVRFGNVLGSSGSVVPKFRAQIKAGGPVTVTHPDITRYFMTIPEAASLVIQAAGMLENTDKRAPVYLLDMGEPVKIVDLAKKMIQLSNKRSIRPGQEIQITFSGLRPGEKLYEELLIGADPQPTVHSKIFRANENYLPWSKMKQLLDQVNLISDLNEVEINQWLMSSIQIQESSDPL